MIAKDKMENSYSLLKFMCFLQPPFAFTHTFFKITPRTYFLDYFSRLFFRSKFLNIKILKIQQFHAVNLFSFLL